MKESCDQFIIANNQYKNDFKNTLNTHSLFLDCLFENEITNKGRNFIEKVDEFNTHFEQFSELLK